MTVTKILIRADSGRSPVSINKEANYNESKDIFLTSK